MNEWPTRRLVDLCDPDRGITYGIVKVGDFVAGGVPVIRGGDIRENTIVFSDEKRVSLEVSNQFKRTIIRGGEILINLISEPGHCAIAPESLRGANVSRDVAVISLGKEVDHNYICYFLKSKVAIDWLNARMQGSVTQKINLGTLKELPVPLPDFSAQAKISSFLGFFDEKIELNRQMNETLEVMARAIFREWFVNFGPTRRKIDGASDPVEIMGGLVADAERAEQLADLFPTNFGENGLPEGWESKGLDQIADFLNGLALQKYPATNDTHNIPVVKIAELRNGITPKSGRASRAIPEKYIVKDGDFLFSWSGSLLAKFWTEGEGALNQHLFKVTSNHYPKWFYSLWVQHYMPEFQQIAASKATTMGHIQRNHLTAATAACPPPNAVQIMGVIFDPIVSRTIHNEIENRTLATTRDLLLPKLMSDEIRLEEAAEALEAAQ